MARSVAPTRLEIWPIVRLSARLYTVIHHSPPSPPEDIAFRRLRTPRPADRAKHCPLPADTLLDFIVRFDVVVGLLLLLLANLTQRHGLRQRLKLDECLLDDSDDQQFASHFSSRLFNYSDSKMLWP